MYNLLFVVNCLIHEISFNYKIKNYNNTYDSTKLKSEKYQVLKITFK